MPSIAFIFAHRPTDKWNTPLAVVEEFKSRGWDTSIYSLFDSNDNYVDDNVYKLLETKPDVILHMDWGRHLSPVLSKLRNTGAFCIMEAGDDPQNFERNVVKAPWFDLILTPDIKSVNEYINRGFNAMWWTHFADIKIYKPLEIKEKYVAVSSRGRGSSQILDALADYYYGDIINQNGWEGEEHTKFLNSGKMVIQHSRWGEITRRIFEGMACSKLVITDRLHKDVCLENLFTEGEDIILYNDIQDCAEKIAYYNNNPEERDRIAWNGYEKVMSNHTQIQRVDLIIEQWKNYQLV
jgi:glycosyltransferase involved in cell wall biosynthesis